MQHDIQHQPQPHRRPGRQSTVARKGSNRAVVILAATAVALTAAIALVACTGVAPTITRGITALAERPSGDAGAGTTTTTDGAFGTDDGVLEENRYSAYDTDLPAIANLDADLLEAVQQATDAAAQDDIALYVSSGWRSTAYQQHLLDEAILQYGSEAAARQYVATPDGSSHTRGAAVDIGATDADYWLIEHGADYGLCQTYANEIWHFELATVPGGECPELLPDAG